VAGADVSEPLPPAYIKFMRQNTVNSDCVVSALAMLSGVTYEVALAACVIVKPDVLEQGMGRWENVKRAASILAQTTRVVPRGRYDLDEDTGLLHVKSRKEDHVVLLWAGRIIEGNGELWLDPDDYLRHYNYQPYSLLVRTA
jgi:hypothetical protein